MRNVQQIIEEILGKQLITIATLTAENEKLKEEIKLYQLKEEELAKSR